MFICNCNGISEQQVEAAINRGCTKPLDIYAGCGKEPKCGRCMDRMWDMLGNKTGQPRPTDLLPAE